MASIAPKHNDWAPVRMHTSKCDHCLKGSYNSSILQRCNLCGRQVCKTCMANFSAEADHEGNVDNCDWSGEVEARKPRAKKGASKTASDEPLRRSTRTRKAPTSKDELDKLQSEKKKPVVKKSQKGKEVNAEPATKKRKGEDPTKDEPASKKQKTDEDENNTPIIPPVAPEPKKQLPAAQKSQAPGVPRIIIKRKAEKPANEEPATKKLRTGDNNIVEPAIAGPAPSPTKRPFFPRIILKHNKDKPIQQLTSKSTTTEPFALQLAPNPKKKGSLAVEEAPVSKVDKDIAPVRKAPARKAAAAKAAAAKEAAAKEAAAKATAAKAAAAKAAAAKAAAAKAAAAKAAAAKVAAQKVAAELKAAEKVTAKKIAAEKIAAEKAAKLAKAAAAKIVKAEKAAAKVAAAETTVNKPAAKKGKAKAKTIQEPEPEVSEEVIDQPSFIPFVFVPNPAKIVSSKFQRNGYTAKPHCVVLPSAERSTILAGTEEEEKARIAEETMLRKELAIQEARDRAEKDVQLAAFRKSVEGEWKTNKIIQRYLQEDREQDAEELFDLAMMCMEAKMEL